MNGHVYKLAIIECRCRFCVRLYITSVYLQNGSSSNANQLTEIDVDTRRRYVRWSCGHQVRHVGFLRVLRFPPTRRPSERKHRCQRA